MFISKATLRPGAARSDAFQRLTARGHNGHRLAWSLFGDNPDRDRDFLFRWAPDMRGSAVMYTVSHRKPSDHAGLFSVQPKPYDPELQAGQELIFQVRVNPVIKKRGEDGKQRVHDVVMNEKWEMEQAGTWEDCELTEAQLVQQEGAKWLRRRTEQYGFDFDAEHVRADGHLKHSFRKPRNGRAVTFTTMDMVGRLRVTNPATFLREALFTGVGPGKAYGCGLMMVKRAQQTA